jgi:5'-nucleotidase
MALVALGVAGCNNNKKTADIPASGSVTDVTAPAPVTPAYQPAPQPVQPVAYDSTTTLAPAGGSMGSGSYTVKKGDTLYGIARQRYGDGKQWNKIAQANPGLRPETLKVGQTIVIP